MGKLANGKSRQILLNASLMESAELGHAQAVEMLLANGAAANFQDEHGETPLLIAARSGDLDTVKMLLAKGAAVNAQNKEGRTVLMRAVERRRKDDVHPQPNQYYDIVKLLLARGVDINAVDKQGMTALKLAQLNDSEHLVKLLRETTK